MAINQLQQAMDEFFSGGGFYGGVGLSSGPVTNSQPGAPSRPGGNGWSPEPRETSVPINVPPEFLHRAGWDGTYTNAEIRDMIRQDREDGVRSNFIYLGTKGNDRIVGSDVDDLMYGDDGDDSLFGNRGNDFLSGGNGTDDLVGGVGSDTIDGGNGYDFASYYTSSTGLTVSLLNPSLNTGDAAGDVLRAIEALGGSNYNDKLLGDHAGNTLVGHGGYDVLIGYAGNDALVGGTGNDSLNGGTGADFLDGGEGTDFAVYESASSGVVANLGNASRNSGEAGGDTYVSVEGLIGSSHSDWLYGGVTGDIIYGNDGNDNIFGEGGADLLHGNWGNDLLSGGTGNDELYGGGGIDTFRFDTKPLPNNVDKVKDFSVAEDILQLSLDIFTAFGGHVVTAADFTIGSAATSASHKLIYNANTGELFYDADGAGGYGQVKFAELSKGLALKASNFELTWA